MHMFHTTRLCCIAALSALCAIMIASAVRAQIAPPCLSAATQYLRTHGIDPARVKRTDIVRIVSLPEIGTLAEYQAWTSFTDCRGNLVLKMTPWCRVKEAYTRGTCQVPGNGRY